ncbi:SGNH/GDSL hydrolase family protein [Pseudomonas granadensis]|uniref:SGNH/GDSL hydrolase family protein n=1 Tax=Pseudomonas granadensis TaxID=1421430 RepID=A0ABX7GBA0_9PSED|nr:GDSL-type esterase/lipase family protein [Pseudomonas granadensis]MBN6776254.1 SGNH/GDSL hydrolase family protein [Pseudomonas granadensis]MBN6807272.1 SGNH/GDSL hydrolase family protein [Pseudomonas granadensis]MBN6834136.1 SGNH/GDSL hydrolase family protein [Pseudomonas granadensis]MBN6841647.1 SGNH/GDSL hydrolase family protein [Pseudomonas granadensis]MBN6870324.1 SGNH/GDSL hydrolase family protein [Pseudomonas granadensis]
MVALDDAQPVSASVIQIGDARERFAQWRAGKAGKVLAVSVIGDSYTAGQDFYLNKLVQRVAGETGFAGPGYVGFNHGAALGGTHFKYTRSSDKYFGGGWKVSDLGQASPDSRTVTGRAGAWLQVDGNPTPRIDTAVTQAKLLYLGNGEASELRYRWSPAQDWQPLKLAGSGVQEVPLAGLSTAKDWSFRLEVLQGAPTLFGLWMRNDQPGIRVSKLAASGAASADFYHADPQWQAQWKAVVAKIPADVYLIMLGGNDQGFGVKPEQYLHNVQGLVGMLREIQPAASINLVMRQDTTRSSAYPMAAYAQVLEPWAREQHLGFTNLQCAFGPDAKRYAAAMIGPDKIHPLPATGGKVIADYFYGWIMGGKTDCNAASR